MKSDCAGIHVQESAAKLAEAGEFQLRFQPVVKPDERRVVALEAFACFDSGTLKANGVSADEMACLVKYRRLGSAFDVQVLTRALAVVNRIERDYGLELPLSVKLGGESLIDPEFPARARQILKQAGRAPELVQFEVSERSLTLDAGSYAGIARLVESGFGLVVDEFISGDSDFGALVNGDINTIKLDPAVSHEMTRSEVARRFIRGLLMLAESLGKRVVVDGVDSYQHFMFLQAIGCSHLQGDYISRALAEAEVAPFVEQFMLSRIPDMFAESESGKSES